MHNNVLHFSFYSQLFPWTTKTGPFSGRNVFPWLIIASFCENLAESFWHLLKVPRKKTIFPPMFDMVWSDWRKPCSFYHVSKKIAPFPTNLSSPSHLTKEWRQSQNCRQRQHCRQLKKLWRHRKWGTKHRASIQSLPHPVYTKQSILQRGGIKSKIPARRRLGRTPVNFC